MIDDMDRSAPKPRKSATQVRGVIGRAEHCLLFFVGGALKGGVPGYWGGLVGVFEAGQIQHMEPSEILI